jgi:DNA-binding CsgD family transcriptional regulator
MSLDNMDQLTERERECLRLVGAGHESKDIARALGCSPHTVYTHIRSAGRKLGVGRRKEAARLLAASEAEPSTQWLSSGSKQLPDTPSTTAISTDDSWPDPMPSLQVLNDGGSHDHDPFASLPPRRWHEWLLRRRRERFNDLTALQTIRSIAIVLLILAASASLMIISMSTWR